MKTELWVLLSIFILALASLFAATFTGYDPLFFAILTLTGACLRTFTQIAHGGGK